VLFEGGAAGDIGFGTEPAVPGYIRRGLEFTLACGELGYGGISESTDTGDFPIFRQRSSSHEIISHTTPNGSTKGAL
jgi:hypothetical protein